MLMKKCSKCSTYTLKEKCPKCGSETEFPGTKYREKFVRKKQNA